MCFLARVTLCQLFPSSCACLMLSSLAWGCAKSNGYTHVSFPDMDIHNHPSMSHVEEDSAGGQDSHWKTWHLTLYNPEQISFSNPEEGCMSQFSPPLCHRRIKNIVYLKVRTGTRTKENHCWFGPLKPHVAVFPLTCQCTQGQRKWQMVDSLGFCHHSIPRVLEKTDFLTFWHLLFPGSLPHGDPWCPLWWSSS